MQKDLEAARLAGDEPYEERPPSGVATWKIVVAAMACLGAVSLAVWLALDAARLASAIFGCGMLILIVYAAFRNEPTVRKRPGNAGNIDFGNR